MPFNGAMADQDSPEVKTPAKRRGKRTPFTSNSKAGFNQLIAEFNRATTIADMARIHLQIHGMLHDMPENSDVQ